LSVFFFCRVWIHGLLHARRDGFLKVKVSLTVDKARDIIVKVMQGDRRRRPQRDGRWIPRWRGVVVIAVSVVKLLAASGVVGSEVCVNAVKRQCFAACVAEVLPALSPARHVVAPFRLLDADLAFRAGDWGSSFRLSKQALSFFNLLGLLEALKLLAAVVALAHACSFADILLVAG
jgi:hypothetical protein